MKKVFRYSKLYYLVLMFIGYICFIFVKGFLYEAFPIENYAYSSVLLVLAILIIGAFIQFWRNTAVKIITDSNSIEIRKPFHSVKFSWEELSEFGKIRRVAPKVGGYWVYYIKGRFRDKKIVLGVKGLKNLEDIVPYILFKAYKAKIVNIQKAEKIEN
jgi:hypothetical protein